MTFWVHHLVGLDPYLAAGVVVPLFFCFGVVVYQLVFRHTIGRSHAVQVFASVGLLILLENLALTLWGADFRAVRTFAGEAVELAGVRMPIGLLIAFGASLAAGALLLVTLRRTWFGKSIRAVTEDRTAATLMGVHTHRTFALAFGIGIACAGLAGTLLMPLFTVYPTTGVKFTLVAFVVVVLGGMGSIVGAVCGGLVVGLVEALAGFYLAPAYQQLAYFLIFVAVLVVRPVGLFGSPGAAEIGEEVA
jgi:branched-chain amino acid transport system permease protein